MPTTEQRQQTALVPSYSTGQLLTWEAGTRSGRSLIGSTQRARSSSLHLRLPSSSNLDTPRRSHAEIMERVMMNLDTPRSFEKVLEMHGPLHYSECKRQMKRERREYCVQLQEFQRENRMELKMVGEGMSPRIDNELSPDVQEARDSWRRFNEASQRAHSEDLVRHRHHLEGLILNALPAVEDRLSFDLEEVRRRCREDHENWLHQQQILSIERARELRNLVDTAVPKVDDELSEEIKEIRRQLKMFRALRKDAEAEEYAERLRALEELCEMAEPKVDAWISPETAMWQQYFQERNRERVRARARACQGYMDWLREMVENATFAVDCYVDHEVRAIADRNRLLALDAEAAAEEAARQELRRNKPRIQRMHSAPCFWLSDSSKKSTQSTKRLTKKDAGAKNSAESQGRPSPKASSFPEASPLAQFRARHLLDSPTHLSSADSFSFDPTTPKGGWATSTAATATPTSTVASPMAARRSVKQDAVAGPSGKTMKGGFDKDDEQPMQSDQQLSYTRTEKDMSGASVSTRTGGTTPGAGSGPSSHKSSNRSTFSTNWTPQSGLRTPMTPITPMTPGVQFRGTPGFHCDNDMPLKVNPPGHNLETQNNSNVERQQSCHWVPSQQSSLSMPPGGWPQSTWHSLPSGASSPRHSHMVSTTFAAPLSARTHLAPSAPSNAISWARPGTVAMPNCMSFSSSVQGAWH